MASFINIKVRPITKWFGGKSFFARRIIELVPDSDIYVEPFAGGLNVLLNKCKYGTEIAGDLNPELIHLYETARDHSIEFLDRLKDIPYSEDVFKRALAAGIVEDPVDRALNFLIKHRMSSSGMGDYFSKISGKVSEQAKKSGWGYLDTDLKFTAYRLQGVEFYNEPALNLIERYDGPNTSFYLDPPYYPSTRNSLNMYEYEMTALQHLFLLKRINKCKGNVVISGYDHPVYNKELAGWEKYFFETTVNSSQSKTKDSRVEVVWVKVRGENG
jgi:DNA adenine methylase